MAFYRIVMPPVLALTATLLVSAPAQAAPSVLGTASGTTAQAASDPAVGVGLRADLGVVRAGASAEVPTNPVPPINPLPPIDPLPPDPPSDPPPDPGPDPGPPPDPTPDPTPPPDPTPDPAPPTNPALPANPAPPADSALPVDPVLSVDPAPQASPVLPAKPVAGKLADTGAGVTVPAFGAAMALLMGSGLVGAARRVRRQRVTG